VQATFAKRFPGGRTRFAAARTARGERRRDLSGRKGGLRGGGVDPAPVVEAERAGTEGRDLQQAARHHHVLEEVDHLVLVGEVAVEGERRRQREQGQRRGDGAGLVAGDFVFYPIGSDPNDPGRPLTNWAVMARPRQAEAVKLTLGDWSRPGKIEQVLPFVRDRFHLDYVDPAEIIRATGAFHEYPNCDREPLPRWSFDRVTLLGDAAHPMYPVGSNGASQAILDARFLAEQLPSHGSVEAALGAYDAERRPATTQIVHSNRKGGPEGVIDLVEARAPDGFDDIEAVASYAEREQVVRGYASLAGFAADRKKGRA
jgi:2-polyprenyl-6-methoxyphenol hydroxylase-like FAD-dependent oxidoreductase